jgi:ATP synthase F1 complex assembly factor 2
MGADFYEINLDQRKVKTPMGSVLLVPGEALAVAVAEEWDAQSKEIKLNEMHLVSASSSVSVTYRLYM